MKGILVDDGGNLMVRGGHLYIGDNREQCARHLIGACTGEYKHAPKLGGNVRKMLAGSADPFWPGDMRKQLSQCGIDVSSVSIDGSDITVEIND